jgi:ATP-dependent protease ClpP protease subunit
MINAIHLSGEVDEQMVDNLLNFVKNLDEGPIFIYLYSPGGDVACGNVILDVINKLENVTLIASGFIYSSAFDVFFFSNCQHKIILEGTVGMTHFKRSTFDINENGQPNSHEAKFALSNIKKYRNSTIQKLKDLGLPSKHLNTVKQGKDAFLTTEELKTLLNGQN